MSGKAFTIGCTKLSQSHPLTLNIHASFDVLMFMSLGTSRAMQIRNQRWTRRENLTTLDISGFLVSSNQKHTCQREPLEYDREYLEIQKVQACENPRVVQDESDAHGFFGNPRDWHKASHVDAVPVGLGISDQTT